MQRSGEGLSPGKEYKIKKGSFVTDRAPSNGIRTGLLYKINARKRKRGILHIKIVNVAAKRRTKNLTKTRTVSAKLQQKIVVFMNYVTITIKNNNYYYYEGLKKWTKVFIIQ